MEWQTDDLRAGAAAGMCAFTACLAIMATPPNDLIVAERDSPVSSAFLSPAWAGAVAVLTALAVLGTVSNHPRRGLVAIAGITGAAVLSAPAVIGVSTALSVTAAGVGSGLILAAAVTLAHRSRTTFTALVLGAAFAYRFSQFVAQQYPDPFRWSVTLPGDTFYPEPVVPIPLLVVTVILLAGAITLPHITIDQSRTVQWRMAAAVIVLWVMYSFLGDYNASVVQWVVAAAATVIVIVGATVGFGSSTAILCVGLAVAGTFVGGMTWNAWWLVPLAIIGFAIGALGAWRAPSVPVGCGILALVCASAVFPYSLVSTVAYAAVLPASIVYALLSCRPTDPMISAVGLLMPTMLSVFTLSAPPIEPYEFGWTAGDDATALVFDPGTVGSRAPVAVVVAIFAALIAAGVIVRRRQRSAMQ